MRYLIGSMRRCALGELQEKVLISSLRPARGGERTCQAGATRGSPPPPFLLERLVCPAGSSSQPRRDLLFEQHTQAKKRTQGLVYDDIRQQQHDEDPVPPFLKQLYDLRSVSLLLLRTRGGQNCGPSGMSWILASKAERKAHLAD